MDIESCIEMGKEWEIFDEQTMIDLFQLANQETDEFSCDESDPEDKNELAN